MMLESITMDSVTSIIIMQILKKGIILNSFKESRKGRKENYTHEKFIKEVEKGSRNAGLIPVLIDRNNFWPNADCLRFENLIELNKYLEEI